MIAIRWPGGRTVLTRVLIVDDHRLVASTLSGALRSKGLDARPANVSSDEEILAAAREFKPAVVLLDLELGVGRSGLGLIPLIREIGAAVIMLTATTDRVKLAECVEAGAVGLLSKRVAIDTLVQAVEAVASEGSALPPRHRLDLLDALEDHRAGQHARLAPFERLTRREEEILAALVEGKAAHTIAAETFTSIRTVRGHIQAVLDKLRVSSQLAAVAKAKEAGWEPRSPR